MGWCKKPTFFLYIIGMIEYYNKIKDGYEFCKKNLESDMSLDQFLAVNKLVAIFGAQAQHYLDQLKKKKGSRRNHKYLLEKAQEWLDELGWMMVEWRNQYETAKAEEEAEDKKRRDIWNSMVIQDEYQNQKDKHTKKTAKKIGFQTSKRKKKSTRKKTKVEES